MMEVYLLCRGDMKVHISACAFVLAVLCLFLFACDMIKVHCDNDGFLEGLSFVFLVSWVRVNVFEMGVEKVVGYVMGTQEAIE